MAARALSECRTPEKPKRRLPSTAFKPGQSGNPGGKSKDQAERDRILDSIASSHALAVREDGRTNAQAAFEELCVRGMSGDTQALVRYLEWVLGKPKERVSVEGLALKLCRREVSDADALGGGRPSLAPDPGPQ